MHLNLARVYKGKFFGRNMRKLVRKALTSDIDLSRVRVKVPKDTSRLPRCHSLDYLEELAVQRRQDIYQIAANEAELRAVLPSGSRRKARFQTQFRTPRRLHLADEHDYKTDIAAIVVDTEERVRALEATVEGMYKEKSLDRGTYSKALSYLNLIQKATEDAYQTTIQIVQALAKVDESAKKKVNLSKLIEKSVLPTVTQRYKKMQVNALYCEIPDIETNADALKDALQAVIDNAASYSKKITVTTARERGKAVIRVYNPGSRLTPEVRKRMFEPMYTTRAEQGGTGVGLALANQYITSMGGRISAKNEDKGVTFKIEVPMAA